MSVFNTVIKEENGKPFKGYIAYPENVDNAPAIIMMHEVYGVTDGLKDVAKQFTDQGFIVLCPNLYWRDNSDASFKYQSAGEEMTDELKADRDAARDLMLNNSKDENIVSDVQAMIDFLREDKKCNGKVAVSGFCFGARNTYLSMAKGVTADAAVAFYPTPKLHEVFDMKEAMKIKSPFMFVVGGEDPYINDDEKEDMIVGSALETLTYVSGRKKPIEEYNNKGNEYIRALYYANSNHGFNRRNSPYSDPGASKHVISAACDFLRVALYQRVAEFPNCAYTTPQSPTYHPQHKV